MRITLVELAQKLEGELRGSPEIVIEQVSQIEGATERSILYVQDEKKLEEGENSKAAALLVSTKIKQSKKPVIVVKNTKLAFARLLSLFHPAPPLQRGVHPTAIVDSSATVSQTAWVGPYAFVGPGASVGSNVQVGPYVLLEEGVTIGDGTILRARATLLRGVRVGKKCVIHEGAVIGSEGFGYATDEQGRHHHVPQIGTVVLEDEVEIGAGTMIDRATLGVTRIKRGTKIDNLVQVGHNCEIGEDCILAAMVGVSGSTQIGDHCIFGGHVGIRDHIKIGEGCIVAGASMIWGDLDAHSFVSGSPARSHKEQLKLYALYHKLPELFERVKELEGTT